MRRGETILWVFAMVSAVLLILVSLNGRTVWIEGPYPSQYAATIRDAAGWDWLARFAGIAGIIALGVGLRARSRLFASAMAILAAMVFTWAAVVAWTYATYLAHGAGEREGWVIFPAANVSSAAVIAGVAASLSLVLAVCWL